MGKASWVGILLALGACGDDGFEDAIEGPRNVLFVITDTLRADKLGCYGNDRRLTPYLDDFAAQGLRFANASSHAPWTMPSIATMLTGLHPKEHGAGGRILDNGKGDFRGLAEGVTTLPSVFRDAGYRTHCIGNVAWLSDGFQVTRGFETRDVDAPASNIEVRTATETTDLALQWIDANKEGPFFLLVHYFDPHAVYDPPRAFRERFALGPDQRNDVFKFPRRAEMMAIRRGEIFPPKQILERAEALHDGEIAYMDSELGRLFAELTRRGLDGSTVVALTGDHGEEFLEHGGFEHGHQLYQEITHVPLLLRAPGLEPGVDDRVVGHVDLAVTLCQLADRAPAEQFLQSGRSLIDRSTGSRPILAHGNMWAAPLTSLRDGNEKLIKHGDGRYELYDLSTDATELVNLAAARPDRVEELAGRLEALERYMNSLARGEKVQLSAADQISLEAMGYSNGLEDEDE